MDITLQQIVFYVTAALMTVFSVLTVATSNMLRSATCLLFVLLGTAMLYFVMDYTFLGTVQIMVYAGGIVILYVFSILLTRTDTTTGIRLPRGKLISIILAILAGAAILIPTLATARFAFATLPDTAGELPMATIGHALTGVGRHQYVLPFELTGILLLACIVGGILIARKEK